MNILLTLIAVVLSGASGCPGLWFGRRVAGGQRLATLLMVAACVLGALPCIRVLLFGLSDELHLLWFLPWGSFALRLDALSAFFLLPILIIPTFGSFYGMEYWAQTDHPENGRKLRFFYGILSASMAMVVLAQDAVLFLIAWEVMAIAAFFLITTEDHNCEAQQAGWVYLIAAHLGTLCLLPMFGLLARNSGSFAIQPLATGVGGEIATAVFFLTVIGFGFKAGIILLHVWLPGAHANAPSHVSAVLSGVMLKMGIYGMVRILSLFSVPPPWWGGFLLALGAATGLIGIVYAIGQQDLKRLLAYSSIENIGIIVVGLGLGVLGRALNEPKWVALGLGGALLHVWNHSLFKPLLFFSAGSVIHATHTREINRLGGLARRLPYTAMLFCVGALAICGLPPLNGFISEILVYVGLFETLGLSGGNTWAGASLLVPVLALIGGLALVCFVKAYGGIFLGARRILADSLDPKAAREAGGFMLGTMFALAASCLVIGLRPQLVFGLIEHAVAAWIGGYGGKGLAPLLDLVSTTWISAMGFSILVLVLICAAAFKILVPRRPDVTWDCGYAAPNPRIQYTPSSFAQIVVSLSRWVLWPKQHLHQVGGWFPKESCFKTYVPDLVLDRGVLPIFRLAATVLPWIRFLQQGRVQIYVFYIFAILMVLFFMGIEWL